MPRINRIAKARPRSTRWQTAVACICAILLSACTTETDTEGDAPGTDGYRGRLLQQPREKVDFVLQDTQGATFDFREQTEGFVTLLFFGYTHCPDVCPIHMANIAAVLKDFSFDLRQQFKVVFVTTDPERDTPQRMRQWLDNFDPAFIGLWGDHDEVNEIAVSLGLPPSIIFESEDGEYAVGHSAHVMVFTKDNLSHILYPFGTRQADWAHDLPGLTTETWDE
jgi:protein SCO1/2